VAIFPAHVHGVANGAAPKSPKTKTLPTRNNIGFLKMLANEDDGIGFKIGRKNKIAMAPNIAETPHSLLGIDLRIA